MQQFEDVLTLDIDVTPEDLAQGNPGSCFKCPIAIALQRAAGVHAALPAASMDFLAVTISSSQCKGMRYIASTPEDFRRFMHDFDANGTLAALPEPETLTFRRVHDSLNYFDR